jgi:FMN phosphatase YigB (HAD superfamily)
VTDGPTRAVTFDLWHTLVYLGPRAEEQYMVRQVDLAVDVLQRSELRRGAIPSGEKALRSAVERERAVAVAAAERGAVVSVADQFLRAARASGRLGRPERYLEALRREVGRTPFRRAPGALAALRALREDGYRVAVISNTVGEPGAFLRPILNSMGFDPLVERYVFSDECGATKPSPAIFRAALSAIGARPAHAIHVGDGWSDVEGARRARLRAGVLFTGLQSYGSSYRKLFLGPGGRLGADYQVDRLVRLPSLARRLLPVEP